MSDTARHVRHRHDPRRRLGSTSDRRGCRYFNSAAFVSRDGKLAGHYDKMHPVMFGEYVPLADRFPWLQRLTPLGDNLSEGQGPAAFTLGKLRIAPNICYETVLSHVIRDQINKLQDRGEEPERAGEPHQRRLVLGLQRTGHAPGLRGVPRGRVPQAAVDRRQHGLLGLDRRRRAI